MLRTFTILSLLLLLLAHSGLAQKPQKPKAIRVKGDYTHIPTSFQFPARIDHYQRTDIVSFNGKTADRPDIAVSYQQANATGEPATTFTVYVYDAGKSTEGRLRDEYLASLQSIANIRKKGIHASQYHISEKQNGFTTHGFVADIKNENSRQISRLVVFECGKWFLKLRISSSVLDTLAFENLQQQLLQLYPPTRLVQQDPLNVKMDIRVAPAAFRDSTMLYAVLGSAIKKLEWANTHVDSLERCAGFPTMYLELHAVSLKEMVKRWDEGKFSISRPSTDQYISELKLIIEEGFLEEFIMDHYHMIMIVPEGLQLDIEAFRSWNALSPTSINLQERFYLLSNAD
jgi:hypothetical protein